MNHFSKNTKRMLSVLGLAIALMVGGNSMVEASEETVEETTSSEILQVGETGSSNDAEFTLTHFEFVDSIYDYPYYTFSSTVSGLGDGTPEDGNTIMAVTFTVKNIGKEAKNYSFNFGKIEYDDGYIFSPESPVGIHLVCTSDSYSTGQVMVSLQPLTDGVEISAFFEVPQILRDNTDAALYYEYWGGNIKYEIRGASMTSSDDSYEYSTEEENEDADNSAVELSLPEILEYAKILDWDETYDVIKTDVSSVDEYNDAWYIYTADVVSISEGYCVLSTSSGNNNIQVYLEKESLEQISVGDTISIVGKFSGLPTEYKMINAVILDNEIISEYFVVAVIAQTGSLSYQYSEYVYDTEIGKIVSYFVSGDENGTHELSYDENGNLVKDNFTPINANYDTTAVEYTYNEDGTVATETDNESIYKYFVFTYEKDIGGRIIKKTSVNVASDNYTQTFEYEYDSEGNIVTEIQTSPNSVYIVNYEYDEIGNVIKKVSYNQESPDSQTTTTYEYGIIAKKNTAIFSSESELNFADEGSGELDINDADSAETEELDKQTEDESLNNLLGNSVETDIVKVTLDEASLAIALNTSCAVYQNKNDIDYSKYSEYNAISINNKVYYECFDEDYGKGTEYIEGETYSVVASKGHTLVPITITIENLDRADVGNAIWSISIEYNGETYSDNIYGLCYRKLDGEDWTSWGAFSNNENGVPLIYRITNHSIKQNTTKQERLYIDIPVDVNSLSDKFNIVFSVKNSSGEYEKFKFVINGD